MHFKYECLPNLCYRCGLLEHDLKDYSESSGNDKSDEIGDLQYGAWLRGDPIKRTGSDYGFAKKKEGVEARERMKDDIVGGLKGQVVASNVVARDKTMTDLQCLKESTLGQKTLKADVGETNTEDNQENGMVNNLRENPKGGLANLGKENLEREQFMNGKRGRMQGATGTQHREIPKFVLISAPKAPTYDCQEGLDSVESGEGPMAMSYEMEVGWVADKLGPKSGHWKRKAWAGLDKENKEEICPYPRKREGPTPLVELDQNIGEAKRKKGENQGKENAEKENVKDGAVAVAAKQHHRAQ